MVKFGARLCPSSTILVHSWDISFSILEHSKEWWGSLEASRGGMLEVIGAVGSRSGLCWRLCCCFGPLVCSLTWAGGFLRSPCETQKNEKWGSASVRKVVLTISGRFCCLCKLAPVGGQIRGMFVPIFGDLGAFLGHTLFHIGAFHPMLGLSWGFSWRYVGSDWGCGIYVEGFAAVILLFCGDVRPLGCFFSAVWLGR